MGEIHGVERAPTPVRRVGAKASHGVLPGVGEASFEEALEARLPDFQTFKGRSRIDSGKAPARAGASLATKARRQ